jgi:hypothetical protein
MSSTIGSRAGARRAGIRVGRGLGPDEAPVVALQQQGATFERQAGHLGAAGQQRQQGEAQLGPAQAQHLGRGTSGDVGQHQVLGGKRRHQGRLERQAALDGEGAAGGAGDGLGDAGLEAVGVEEQQEAADGQRRQRQRQRRGR